MDKKAKKGRKVKKRAGKVRDVKRDERERILIVDDDEGTCRSLSLILDKKGYETEAAGSGREALEKAQEAFFNMALLDIKLPDMEGVELLAPLKEMHPDMALITITAYASTETAVRALNEGASAYITKPLNMDEVLATIGGALEKQRLAREKRQIEEALRESEKSLKRTQLMAHVGGWEWDLTSGSFRFSEEMYRIYGQPDGRQFDDPWSMIDETIHPDDRERVLDEARRVTEEPQAVMNYRVVRPDGEIRWIEAPAPEVKRRASDGSPEVMVGAVLDITERVQAEEALRESEEKLRIMFDSVGDAIAVTDISGKIVDLNRAAVSTFGGRNREEWIGRDAFEYIAESSRAKAVEHMSKVLEGQSLGLAEYTFVTEDGTEFEAESSNALLRDALGNPAGFVSVNRNVTERKRTQEELVLKDRAMESSINAIDIVDLQGVNWEVQYVNRAFLDMWGYEDEGEVLNRSAKDFWMNAGELEGIVWALDEEGSWAGELAALRKDGSTFDAQVSAGVVRDEEGTPICLVGSFVDITERKGAEEALRESEERYRLLAENVTDVIWTMDMNLRITYISPSVTAQRGYTVEEAMAQDVDEMMTPDSVGSVTEALAEGLAMDEQGHPQDVRRLEAELYCKDGSTIWTEIDGRWIRDSEGEIVGAVGVARDITERKRTEQALLESEERYRTIFKSASDAIFTLRMTDEGPRFADYNPNALKLYGCKHEELLDASPLDFAPTIQPDGSSSAERVAEIQVATMAGEPQSFEWLHQRLDGTLFDAEVTVARVDIGGEDYLQAVVRDVTERKQAEEALRESEERYRSLFERAPASITVVDTLGRVVDCNEATEVLTGYSRGEVIGKTFEGLPTFDPEDLSNLMNKYETLLQGQEIEPLELQVLRKDGDTRWIVVRSSLLFSGDSLSGFQIFATDITERRQAEQGLRESEEKWRSLVENAPNHILIVDCDGVIQFINRARPGTTVEETLGASAYDFTLPGYDEVLKEALHEVFDAGRPSVFESHVAIPGHGELEALWYHTMVAPIKHDDQVVAATLIATDITDRMEAQEALRRSEERFRALVEATPDWIWEVDGNGAYTYCSPRVKELLGYAPEELIGKTPFDLMPPDEGNRVLAVFHEVMGSKGPLEGLEKTTLHKDGHAVILETNGVPVFDSQGDLVGYRGVNRDITERRRAEQALRESAERMRSLFENSPDIIMEVDRDGRLLFMNYVVSGFTMEEVIGTFAFDYLAPEYRDGYVHAVARVFDTGEPLRIETKGAGPGGRVSWYETRLGPVMREGQVATAMLIASDVTERREAQEQLDLYREHLEELVNERTAELEDRTTQLEARSMELQEANERLQESDRLKSVFLASMSHELRTPLNSIIGFTGIILQGMVGEINEEQKRQLSMVKSSASHLLELINDLLDVSRVEAGRVDLWLEEFSLDDVVREVAETCLPMVNEKGLDFRTEVPENITLFTDRRRMKQILMNFASNAVKFSDRGSVKIAARVLDGEKLEMRVTDMGIGIERGSMDKLFKPFEQIDVSLPKRYEGSGLGLYLSKKLADLLGGDIRAESEYGVGSEFTFVLPLKYGGGLRDEEEDIGG